MDYRQWRDEMRQAIDRYLPRIQAVVGDLLRLEPDTVTDGPDSAALRRAEAADPPLPPPALLGAGQSAPRRYTRLGGRSHR
ncbi:hypothetical protein [Amycolatopsis sp. NPDC054798]